MLARISTVGVRIFSVSVLLASSLYAASMNRTDKQVIRNIVNQALERLNKGDATAILDYRDDNADYVGVDGR